MTLCIMTRPLHFGLISPKVIALEHFVVCLNAVVQMQFNALHILAEIKIPPP